jgi:hypothetical protein
MQDIFIINLRRKQHHVETGPTDSPKNGIELFQLRATIQRLRRRLLGDWRKYPAARTDGGPSTLHARARRSGAHV